MPEFGAMDIAGVAAELPYGVESAAIADGTRGSQTRLIRLLKAELKEEYYGRKKKASRFREAPCF